MYQKFLIFLNEMALSTHPFSRIESKIIIEGDASNYYRKKTPLRIHLLSFDIFVKINQEGITLCLLLN